MNLQKDEDFEKAWQENRHIWESTKNLAKAMFYAGQAKAQAVPEGFVLVPKEPTNKMIDAGYESSYDAKGFEIPLIYKAMIEAQEPAND